MSPYRWIQLIGAGTSVLWSLEMPFAEMSYGIEMSTIAQYVECFEWLKSKGFGIYGVVTEGMKGLPLPSILTQDPDIEASKKLLDLVDIITKTDKESFAVAFNGWYEKYKDVINERVRDKQNVKYLLICARDCKVRI